VFAQHNVAQVVLMWCEVCGVFVSFMISDS